MSILDDLARVRAAGGHEPLPDPTKIQGFGPDSAPVPPYVPRNEVQYDSDVPREWLENEIDSPGPELPPSPLIPRKPSVAGGAATEHRVPADEQARIQQAISAPAFSLMVADQLASWKQRNVTLTATEEKAIRAIVLKAIKREVDADLRDVEQPPTRRTRTPKHKLTMEDAALALPPAAFQPSGKRRPGRPRKEKTQ